MSAQHFQQLQQDLQNELITTNQLLHRISNELQQIKEFTSPGGRFEANIRENASTMDTLAGFVVTNVDINSITPIRQADFEMNNHSNQNLSYEEHDTIREDSNLEESK